MQLLDNLISKLEFRNRINSNFTNLVSSPVLSGVTIKQKTTDQSALTIVGDLSSTGILKLTGATTPPSNLNPVQWLSIMVDGAEYKLPLYSNSTVVPTSTPASTVVPTSTPASTVVPTSTPASTNTPTINFAFNVVGPDGEDATNQIGITSPPEHRFYYNSKPGTSTESLAVMPKINGQQVAMISFTSDRVGTQFGYSTTGSVATHIGTFSNGFVDLTSV
jgi:hypothetical protein